MKKKTILKPMMMFLAVLFSCAQFNLSAIYMTSDQKNQIDKLTNQINALQKEIHEKELKSMKAGVDSEKYMMYEGDKYMDEIQKSEKFDQMVQLLQKQVETLKQRKNELMNQKARG